MQPYTLLISDLHLQESDPQTTQAYLSLLTTEAKSTDALYILGDFFEFWIGDDDNSSFNQQIKTALKQLRDTGVPVYFMRGNRDFFIGERFMHETGCQLLSDPTVVDIYATPVILSHGDILCTQDRRHLTFRRLTNVPILRWLFLSLPLALRKKIGQKVRDHSKARTSTLAANIMDVSADAVEAILRQHKTGCLIHGHTHRPKIHEIIVDDIRSKRIVLGAWHQQASFLKWYRDGTIELISKDLVEFTTVSKKIPRLALLARDDE